MRDLKVYAAPVIVPEQFKLTPEETDRLLCEGNEHTSLDVVQVFYKAGFRAGQECERNEIEEDYCAASDALEAARTMLESFMNNARSVKHHPKADELARADASTALDRYQALDYVLFTLEERMRTLSPAD